MTHTHPEHERLRVLRWAMAVIACVVLAMHLHKTATILVSGAHHDLVHFRLTCEQLLHGRPFLEPPPATQLPAGWSPYVPRDAPLYPPSSFLLLIPLTMLPWIPTMALWLAFRLGCIWGSWWLTLRCLTGSRPSRDTWVVTAILTALYYPIHEDLLSGQTVSLILALHVMGLAAIQRRHWWGGCLLALGNVLKPHLHLVWLAVALERRRAALAAGLATTALVEVLTWLIARSAMVAAYTQPQRLSLESLATYGHSHSLSMTALRFFDAFGHPERLPWLALTLVIITGGGLLYYSWRTWTIAATPQTLVYRYAFILSWLWLWSPLTHITHLTWFLLPCWLLWIALEHEERRFPRWLFLFGYLLLAVRFSVLRFSAFQSGWLSLFAGGHALGMLCITLLCVRQLHLQRQPAVGSAAGRLG